MSIENQQPKEVVDLESYAKAGKPVPPGQTYRIKIDKQTYEVLVETMTGREILTLAGKTPPEQYILQQKSGPNVKRIGLDDSVSFVEPGIERFMTIPNEVTEGESPQRIEQFAPLADDRAYLDSLGLRWEAVIDGPVQRIVIHEWPIPHGYNTRSASVNVRLETGYPDAQIDMAYFYPHLSRADGRPINGLTTDNFNGCEWQRWSRHRTSISAWRIGIDNLETHMLLVADWLNTELSK
jgi:hypothetical protein